MARVLTYRETMTERALMTAIQEAAAYHGWLVFHDEDSRRNVAGWPDLFLVRDSVALVYETKTATGRVRTMQREWLDALRGAVIVRAEIVRPDGLDEVLAELSDGSA